MGVGKGRIGAGKHYPGGKENVCGTDKIIAKSIHSEARVSKPGSASYYRGTTSLCLGFLIFGMRVIVIIGL